MVSKRLEEARQAFRRNDSQASAAAHDPEWIAHATREEHGGASQQYSGALLKGIGG